MINSIFPAQKHRKSCKIPPGRHRPRACAALPGRAQSVAARFSGSRGAHAAPAGHGGEQSDAAGCSTHAGVRSGKPYGGGSLFCRDTDGNQQTAWPPDPPRSPGAEGAEGPGDAPAPQWHGTGWGWALSRRFPASAVQAAFWRSCGRGRSGGRRVSSGRVLRSGPDAGDSRSPGRPACRPRGPAMRPAPARSPRQRPACVKIFALRQQPRPHSCIDTGPRNAYNGILNFVEQFQHITRQICSPIAARP